MKQVSKSPFHRVPEAFKVKSHFPNYFLIEDCYSKFLKFNLSTKKYFKEKKVLVKNIRFCSGFLLIFFMVILMILREQTFNLGL